MTVLRLDADHQLLIVGCTYAMATTFGEDEPRATDAWSAEDGTVADVVIDIDGPCVTAVAERRGGTA